MKVSNTDEFCSVNERVMDSQKNKEFAKKWIESGKPCVYRYGWGWKGAGARTISKEEALKLLPKYDFGKGFYELDFIMLNGREVLEFNELSENDMW